MELEENPTSGADQSFATTSSSLSLAVLSSDDTQEANAAKRRRLENCHYHIKRFPQAGLFCEEGFPEHLRTVPIRQVVEGMRIAMTAGLPAYALLSPDGT